MSTSRACSRLIRTHEGGETLYFNLLGDHEATAALLAGRFADHGDHVLGARAKTVEGISARNIAVGVETDGEPVLPSRSLETGASIELGGGVWTDDDDRGSRARTIIVRTPLIRQGLW